MGYQTVLWSLDSQDWLHIASHRIAGNIFKKVRPGSIILLHDRLNTGTDHGMRTTVEALPSIIDSLSRAGFTFVTIAELNTLHPYGSPAGGINISFDSTMLKRDHVMALEP